MLTCLTSTDTLFQRKSRLKIIVGQIIITASGIFTTACRPLLSNAETTMISSPNTPDKNRRRPKDTGYYAERALSVGICYTVYKDEGKFFFVQIVESHENTMHSGSVPAIKFRVGEVFADCSAGSGKVRQRRLPQRQPARNTGGRRHVSTLAALRFVKLRFLRLCSAKPCFRDFSITLDRPCRYPPSLAFCAENAALALHAPLPAALTGGGYSSSLLSMPLRTAILAGLNAR